MPETELIRWQPEAEPIDGAYADWMRSNAGEYATQYMGYKDYMDTYLRYAGPLKEDGTSADKPYRHRFI